MKNGRLNGFIFFAILITSFVLFTLPGSSVPTIYWLNIPYLDKFIHAFIFLLLTISFYYWLVNSFTLSGIKRLLIVCFILVGYGISIEFIQHTLIKGRSFEGMDILADTSGCLIFILYYLIRKWH